MPKTVIEVAPPLKAINHPFALQFHHACRPFRREPDFGVTSVNYDLAGLLARAGEPS